MLELSDRDFKATILTILNEVKKTTFERIKKQKFLAEN